MAAAREFGDRAADASLLLIGGPSGLQGRDELDAIHRAVVRHRLGMAIRLLPPQPHEILSTYFRAADVCLVPSHSESFGLVALEAAACGLPVVASAVGGLTTIVEDGRTGLLVDGRDPTDFAKPLAAILNDADLADRMGRRAAIGAQAYTWRQAGQDLWSRVVELTRSELVACG